MYYIANGKMNKKTFEYFKDAFEHQQKHYPDKKIFCSTNNVIEIVWLPEWEKISVDDLEKKECEL